MVFFARAIHQREARLEKKGEVKIVNRIIPLPPEKDGHSQAASRGGKSFDIGKSQSVRANGNGLFPREGSGFGTRFPNNQHEKATQGERNNPCECGEDWCRNGSSAYGVFFPLGASLSRGLDKAWS